MRSVSLLARKAFTHKGRDYQQGERFSLPAIDSVVLRNRGMVLFARGAVQTTAMVPESAPSPTPEPLPAPVSVSPPWWPDAEATAQPDEADVEPSEPDPEPEPESEATPRRRRTYRRRDLKAED